MEGIEKIRKQLQCQKCHEPYNLYIAWIRDQCGHHTCSKCSIGASYDHSKCPVCNCLTIAVKCTFVNDVYSTLNSCESSILKFGEVEATLRNENAILKQEKILLEVPPDHYKCIECDKLYSDQDMQLCETCHELKFEDHEDVKKNALCAGCAIRKHIRQGHKTVDFFPYLSAYNFSSQSPKINADSEEFKSARDLLKETFIHFNGLSINVSENYDLLTDMARRSKNTKNQHEFFEKMKTFIDKSKLIHVNADSDMKNHTTKLEDTLAEIKAWYESRMGDCVNESEIVEVINSEDSDNTDTEVET